MVYSLSMAKRKKKEHDFAVTAFRVVQEATEGSPERKKIDYKALERKGGLKGGKVRAEKLSPERWREIAKKAAEKRWQK
jgi:hypothetical protein